MAKSKALILLGVLFVTAILVANWSDRSAERWQPIEVGISVMDLPAMQIYRVDQTQYQFNIANQEDPLHVVSWQEKLPNAAIGINAFFFEADFSPSGLLKIEGVDVGLSDFGLHESAMVAISDELRIVDTLNESLDLVETSSYGQSFPLLLRDGQSTISRDSGKKALRSFIGSNEQYVYVGITEGYEPSLYVLANELESLKLDWKNVLNLDGGPSSGMFVNANEYHYTADSVGPIPSLIYATGY